MRLSMHRFGKATSDAAPRIRTFGIIDYLTACLRGVGNTSRQRQSARCRPKSAPVLLLILIASALLVSRSTSLAQNASNMLRLFGGLMQGAIAEGAKAEWRKVRSP